MRQRGGFTLLELILAMALTCMLAVTLYAALRLGFRAQASATAGVESLRSAQVALQLIGRDIGGALPPTGILAGAFYGVPRGTGGDTSDMVQFYAISSGVSDPVDQTRQDGIWRIEFAIEPGDGGVPCLVRRVQRNLTSMEEFLPDSEVLCRNVASLTIRYFDGMMWAESWDSTAMQDSLPLAVEVTLELEPAGRAARGYRMVRTFVLPCTDPAKLSGEAL
jgi:type II secretion system protein J